MPKIRKFDPREFSDAPLPDTKIDPPVTRPPKDKRSPWLGGTAGDQAQSEGSGVAGSATHPENKRGQVAGNKAARHRYKKTYK
jgi:hypothetical protein